MSSAETAETAETADEDAAPEPDELRDAVLAELTESLGDAIVATELIPGRDLFVRVERDSWVAAAEAAKARGFDFFDFVSAIDWKPSPYGRYQEAEVDKVLNGGPDADEAEMTWGATGGATRFQAIARLYDIGRNVGVHLRCDVPEDDLRVASWVGVFAGANWHEREIHEMYGIVFDGHPYLENLYLPSGFEGYPLRKDYPLLARMVKPWPGIVDVEPMPEADDAEDADDDSTTDVSASEEASA